MKNFLIIITLLFFFTSSCNSLPDIGGKVTVSEQCAAAFSEHDYKEMLDKATSEDLAGMQEMIRSGKIIILQSATSATLLAKGTQRAQVEVEIKGQKQKVWVERENLK